MKTVKKSVLSLALLGTAVLSSCGSTGNSEPSSSSTTELNQQSSTTSTTATISPAVNSGSLIKYVSSIGCDAYQQSTETAPFTVEWGSCSFDGTNVKAYLFPNAPAIDEFFKMIQSFGILKEQTAIKGNFVLAPDDATKLGLIRTAMGL